MLGPEEPPSRPAGNAWSTASRRKPRTIDIAALEGLDREECIERWQQMFGVAPPKYTSLEFMLKALAYEAQVKAFGGHSKVVQKALKASLKAVRSEFEADSSADANADTSFDNLAPIASAACVEPEAVIKRSALNSDQTIRHDKTAADACDQTSNTGSDSTKPNNVSKANGKAKTNTSPKHNRSTKPSVLSIRAGTHLVREWNGRTYQVEALDKGFRLDGKTYRSLSAIAKKITGAHWSGPRFFGLES